MKDKYDKGKIERMKRYIFNEYNRDSIVGKIINVASVKKTDGTFTQIGIRPLVDEDMLISPNYSPELPMAGRMISIGERDHLINRVLNEEGIKQIEIKEADFSPQELQKHLEDTETLILPVNVEMMMMEDQEWMQHIEFKGGQIHFNSVHNIIFVPTRLLSKIVIIDKLAIFWEKVLFFDKTTNKKEKLEISIGETHPNKKIDITIRSLNKLKFTDKSLIKVIELV